MLEIQPAKSRTSRIFNFRCLANKVTPKNLENILGKEITFSTGHNMESKCSLIHNRIKCTNFKINHLQNDLANTKTSLQQKFDDLHKSTEHHLQ